MIYLDGGSFDVQHGLESFLGTLSAVLLAAITWYTFQYQKKKDAQEKAEREKKEEEEHADEQRQDLLAAIKALEQKTEQRHIENKDGLAKFGLTLSSMGSALRYIRLHRHNEDKPGEVLTKDGIEYGPEQW